MQMIEMPPMTPRRLREQSEKRECPRSLLESLVRNPFAKDYFRQKKGATILLVTPSLVSGSGGGI